MYNEDCSNNNSLYRGKHNSFSFKVINMIKKDSFPMENEKNLRIMR